nr:hypothetical protein [Catenulispora rubra]
MDLAAALAVPAAVGVEAGEQDLGGDGFGQAEQAQAGFDVVQVQVPAALAGSGPAEAEGAVGDDGAVGGGVEDDGFPGGAFGFGVGVVDASVAAERRSTS